MPKREKAKVEVASKETLNENKENTLENSEVNEIFDNANNKENFDLMSDPKALEDKVEGLRSVLHARFKKSKKMSNIAMAISVVLIVTAFILLVQKDNMVTKITGYVLIGVALVGMIIFYSMNKSKFPSATKDYINELTTHFNGFTFHDECYKTLSANPDEKLDQASVVSDRVYALVNNVASRNVIHTEFDNQKVTVADIAVYRPEKNKSFTLFVGKYLSMPNNINFEGRVIVQLKKIVKEKDDKVMDSPTDIDDLVLVKDDEDIAIYIDPNYDYKEVLGTKLISDLRAIKIEKHLLNINVVVWGGHTAVYMSFDDEMMVFPFENVFKSDACVQYEELQKHILGLLASLNETREIKKLDKPIKGIKPIEHVDPEEKESESLIATNTEKVEEPEIVIENPEEKVEEEVKEETKDSTKE